MLDRTPITFKYNRDKTFQVALWFLSRHGGVLHRLKLVKLLFLADRTHLAKYGRPISGGSYVAMKLGPVCSEFLDDLKKSSRRAVLPVRSEGHKVVARTAVDEDQLSESDIEVLREVNDRYGNLDRFALADLTHKLKAWVRNYPNLTANTSRPLPYEDFFLDLPNDEMLEFVQENHQAWSGLA